MMIRLLPGQIASLAVLPLLLAASALAQPAVTAVSPAANLRNAPRSGPVQITFSQPLAASSTSALKVFSNQRGGQLAGFSGPVSASGNMLTFTANGGFRAGETVHATLTAAARDANGLALAQPRVFDFTAATSASSGTFGGGLNIDNGYSRAYVVAGDLDNDGDLDVIADIHSSFSGSTGASTSGMLQYTNNGNGTFTAASTFFLRPAGGFFSGLFLCDFDGDGDLDLVHNGSARLSIEIQVNDGSGQFTRSVILYNNTVLGADFMADVDADGDLDLFQVGGRGVQVLLNGGTGIFTNGADIAGSVWAGADFDGDGDTDLVGSALQFNNGAGVFTAGPAVTIPTGNSLTFMKAADVDGDNDADLVLAYQPSGSSAGTEVLEVRLNNGSGSFSTSASFSAAIGGVASLADVDGDGDLDLLATSSTGISLLLNDGRGGFTPGPSTPLSGPASDLVAADIDGDGDVDLLATSYQTSGTYPSSFLNTRFNQNTALPVRSGTLAAQIEVFPNPAKQQFKVSLPAMPGVTSAQLALRNALGQRVLTRAVPVQPAGTQVEFNAASLPAGMYLLSVEAGSQQFAQRVILE